MSQQEYQALKQVFPLLNQQESQQVSEYMHRLIVYISKYYGLDQIDTLYRQLRYDQNKDFNGIILMLFPYVDITQGPIMIEQLKDLAPKYSNIHISQDKEFGIYHIDQQFKFLVYSISYFGMRLYVNWDVVLPVPMSQYKKSSYYLNTLKCLSQGKLYEIRSELDIDGDQVQQWQIQSMNIALVYDVMVSIDDKKNKFRFWQQMDKDQQDEMRIKMHEYLKVKHIDKIFQHLIKTGQLTQINFNQVKPTSVLSLEQVLNECYYYLTDKPYRNESKWATDAFEQKLFFFTFYSLNWITQLKFFNNFLNNRIIYVTGTTGSGKSTQVPKLALYALKSTYHRVGKILCTQPRIDPTQNNAKTINEQLGMVMNSSDKAQYYVQYQHGLGRYENLDQKYYLKFIIDVLMMLLVPTMNTSYDILMVDEAHEHGISIDNVLNYYKNITYWNNEMKLIIISATMEQDEPIYRKFYKCIEDDLSWVGNQYLKYMNLTRVNVDRRFDISARVPYTVKEEWLPGMEYQQCLNRIYKQFELADSIGDHDILLFLPSSKQIQKAVSYINHSSDTPSNIIALPYYRDVSKEYKQFINDIWTTKHQIRIKRQDLNVGQVEVKDLTTGNSHYDHIILIATNIAEASITIKTLKYVIDTGLQNFIYYDYKRNIREMQQTIISQQSRLQRRGRVGRTSNGYAYYLYSKEEMLSNKLIYPIVSDDITQSVIWTFMGSKSTKEFDYYLYTRKRYLGDVLLSNKPDDILSIDENGKLSIDQIIDHKNIFYQIHPGQDRVTVLYQRFINSKVYPYYYDPNVINIFRITLDIKLAILFHLQPSDSILRFISLYQSTQGTLAQLIPKKLKSKVKALGPTITNEIQIIMYLFKYYVKEMEIEDSTIMKFKLVYEKLSADLIVLDHTSKLNENFKEFRLAYGDQYVHYQIGKLQNMDNVLETSIVPRQDTFIDKSMFRDQKFYYLLQRPNVDLEYTLFFYRNQTMEELEEIATKMIEVQVR